MSNEVRVNLSLQIKKSNEDISRRTNTLMIDQTGDGFVHAKQNIGDTPVALDMGSVTDIGAFMFLNHSTLYRVKIGIDGSGTTYFLDIPPGLSVSGYGLDCNTPYALASDSTGVELEYWFIQV